MSRIRSGWPEAQTDAAGRFELGSLDAGVYLAWADVERGDRAWRLRREVEPAPDDVTWTLEEGPLRLRVLVLDPEGRRVRSASAHLVVGDRALYAFVSDGVALFHEFRDTPFSGDAGLVVQLFPDEGPDLWAATEVPDVNLAAGEATVHCARGAAISGRVSPGTDGHVLRGTVYARATGGRLRPLFDERKAAVEPDGSFRFDAMAPGPWILRLLGGDLEALTGDTDARAGDDDVTLTPFPTTTVRVLVVEADGRPVEGALVSSHRSGESAKDAATDARGIAVLEGLRTGVPRSLRAASREHEPAFLESWSPADTTLTLQRRSAGEGESAVAGVVRDALGAPVSFVAVWGRQGTRVGKASADEAGRFRIEGLERGPVTLEVRLAPGWDQPESMEVAMRAVLDAPAEGVVVVVDLGATVYVRFANWPFDVDREGAVLVDETRHTFARPVDWTWSRLRFGRLDPSATYTLFVHAAATDLYAWVRGVRPGASLVARLQHGSSLEGRVVGVADGEDLTVVARLLGVDMEADVAPDGRFEIRGLPHDATVDLRASSVATTGARREGLGRARAGDADAQVVLTEAAAPGR